MPDHHGPQISVGIPTFNRSRFLLRAIESVLAQSHANVEVVVSDNASTDDTERRLRGLSDPRLVVLRQAASLGMIGNFNACLARASGELFLLLSDDDVLEPTALEELSAPFLVAPGGSLGGTIGLSWCPCVIVGSDGDVRWRTDPGPAVESAVDLVVGYFDGERGPRLSSVMLRTEEVRAAGGYHADDGPICDVGTWARVGLRHDLTVCVRRELVRYTIHPGSETSRADGLAWQRGGEAVVDALTSLLRERGDAAGERRLRASGRNFVSNIVATVIMQGVGKPGWVGAAIREAFRAPRHVFRPFVLRRLLRDGHKLIALRGR